MTIVAPLEADRKRWQSKRLVQLLLSLCSITPPYHLKAGLPKEEITTRAIFTSILGSLLTKHK